MIHVGQYEVWMISLVICDGWNKVFVSENCCFICYGNDLSQCKVIDESACGISITADKKKHNFLLKVIKKIENFS